MLAAPSVDLCNDTGKNIDRLFTKKKYAHCIFSVCKVFPFGASFKKWSIYFLNHYTARHIIKMWHMLAKFRYEQQWKNAITFLLTVSELSPT